MPAAPDNGTPFVAPTTGQAAKFLHTHDPHHFNPRCGVCNQLQVADVCVDPPLPLLWEEAEFRCGCDYPPGALRGPDCVAPTHSMLLDLRLSQSGWHGSGIVAV
jgi:hypothetical protein